MKKAILPVLALLLAVMLLVPMVPQTSAKTPIVPPPYPFPETKGPRLNAIRFKVIPNPDQQWLALQQGELDLLGWSLPPDKVPDAVADPNIEVTIVDEYGFFYVAPNCRTYPMNQTWFRQAFARLIDRDGIVSELLGEYGAPLYSVVQPLYGVWYSNEAGNYTKNVLSYNPSAANDSIAAHGWVMVPSGDSPCGYWWDDPATGESPDAFEIISPSYDPIRVEACNKIAAAAKSIGLKVSNNPIDFNTLIERAFYSHDFDFYCLGWRLGADVDYLYYFFHSDNDYYGGDNAEGFHNDTCDYWCEVLITTDNLTEAIEAAHMIQLIVAQECAYYPLYYRKAVHALRAVWANFYYSPGYGMLSGWNFFNIRPADRWFGGELKFGMLDDVRSLNPFVASSVWDWYVLGEVLDGLVASYWNESKGDYEYIPWMAEEFTPKPGERFTGTVELTLAWDLSTQTVYVDGIKVYFKLRQGIKWSDGQEVTVDDIWYPIYLFYTSCALSRYAPGYTEVAKVVGWVKHNDYEITFYLNSSSIYAWDYIAGAFVLPKHVLETMTDPMSWDPFGPDIVGNGPFLITERVAGYGGYILEEYNENYWNGYPTIQDDQIDGPRTGTVGDTLEYTINLGIEGTQVHVIVEETGAVYDATETSPGVYTVSISTSGWSDGGYHLIFEAYVARPHTILVTLSAPTPTPIPVLVVLAAPVVAAIIIKRRK